LEKNLLGASASKAGKILRKVGSFGRGTGRGEMKGGHGLGGKLEKRVGCLSGVKRVPMDDAEGHRSQGGSKELQKKTRRGH